MRYILGELPGRGEWCSPDLYIFKLGASAGSEATQQIPQGIPSLASTCLVFAYLGGGVGSQGVIKVRPAEFMRPKQTKIWLCNRRALHHSGMQGKMFSILVPHNCLSQIVPGARSQQGGATGS